MKIGNQDLASGTAFFYRRNDRLFLISNWHNYSGRDPRTQQPLADHAGVPDRVSCFALLNGQYIERDWLDIPLSNCERPEWYEHPQSGREVDVAALPVTLDDRYIAIAVNQFTFTEMVLRVSHDVFILGYPLGLMNPHGLPVWKRASVASEPGGSAPFFLVDSATRTGMSGAPVIHRYRGYYKTDPEPKKVSPDDWFGEGDNFVGIYSGRLGASHTEAQLGMVWKPHLIDEIIDGSCKAEY